MTATGPDGQDDPATLIAEAARSAQDARRYRSLATAVADPVFERVLAIGSEIRRAMRAGMAASIAAALDELRSLHQRCEEAVREVRASAPYRELTAAYGAGAVTRATTLAAEVFTDVVVASPGRLLRWAVPLTGRRSDEHFLPPERCARSIRAWAASGLTAPTEPPDMGGDAAIRPLPLTESTDPSEGPITLAFDPHVLPGPVGRFGEHDVRLWYAERLHAPFTVYAAPTVGDEWWEIRPAAYHTYLAALRDALTAAGIPFVIARSEA